jgi:RNA polymerase sigma factor (sigma-70 family)
MNPQDSWTMRSPDPENDSQTRWLLEAVPLDPEGSWETLLRRAESRLRVLASFRGRQHDADDLLQEVWIEALASLGRFEYRGPGSLQRWLSGILRNKLREDARRAGRALPAPAASEAALAPQGLFEALRASQPGVSTDAGRREAEERVRAVLEGLPADDREAILLRLYEGLTVREAGARLGVDPSTVSVRMQRALERCAARLQDLAP